MKIVKGDYMRKIKYGIDKGVEVIGNIYENVSSVYTEIHHFDDVSTKRVDAKYSVKFNEDTKTLKIYQKDGDIDAE
jgi:hypothetical protein